MAVQSGIRFRRHDGGTTGGQYPGLDRYGRVKRQLWVDGNFSAGSGGNPNIPPIVETLYTYDLASNRIGAVDDRPGQAQPLSHQYTYDGLQRLVEAKRGVASGGSVTAGAFSQRWHDGSGNVTLDALGNWYQSWTDFRGDGYGANTTTDFDQRTHEGMNRIVTQKLAPSGTTIDLGVGTTPDFDYDDAANLRSHKIWNGTGTSTTTLTYKHDAWNRLVAVDFGGSVRALQGYNALHWRTCKVADAVGSGTGPTLGPDGAIDQVRLMYYDATWRLLEERVDDAAASTTTLEKLYDGTWAVTAVDRTQQNLWGLRYIDDIVLHRTDRNRDGDYVDTTDGTWYHLTDAQFSTVCLTDVNANVVERVTYSAYGIARHHWMADVNGDGAVTTSGTTSDRGIINGIAGQTLANRTIGGSAYRAEADLDRSGVIDITDRGLASTGVAARPDGQVTDISATGPDNVIAWDGYVFNAEPGLYVVRHRTYGPRLGRWLERDPAGYVDSTNLFQSLRSSPLSRVDPSGTDSFAVEWEKRNNARKARVKRVRDAVSEGACGDCCEVRVYATSAFFTGFYHLCIEADTPSGQAGLCDTTTAELLRANETGREAERVGEGPVGGIFGSVRSGSSQSSDDASVDSIGGSPNRAWGIYVASGKRCRSGEALDASFVEPAAGSGKDQCELARCIREAASRIGAAAGAAKHAYDPLENNSNSFIGQIIRECGGAFDSAIDVKNAPAFNNPFFKGNT